MDELHLGVESNRKMTIFSVAIYANMQFSFRTDRVFNTCMIRIIGRFESLRKPMHYVLTMTTAKLGISKRPVLTVAELQLAQCQAS